MVKQLPMSNLRFALITVLLLGLIYQLPSAIHNAQVQPTDGERYGYIAGFIGSGFVKVLIPVLVVWGLC